MGKARIISDLGEGKYRIERLESRERAEAARAMAEAKIAQLQGKMQELEQKQEEYQSQLNALVGEQENLLAAYKQQMQTEGYSKLNPGKYIAEISELSSKRNSVRLQAGMLELQIKSHQSLIARVNGLPRLQQVEAWCADYTEELSGEVATAEVNGEGEHLIVLPAHNGNAWNPQQHGAIQPTLASTPAATFYNLAMFPGWQKWRPTHRTAKITSLNQNENTCSITLDAATSHQQSLNINAQSSYSNVPIQYMDCNAGAFEDGDEVLVEFQGQDPDKPRVIGFVKEPKPCYPKYIVYRSFLQHWFNYNAVASNYEDYESIPEDHPHDRYAHRMRRRVNPSSESFQFFGYHKKEQVADIPATTDYSEARDFSSENLRSLWSSQVDRNNTPINRFVSDVNLSRFSFEYKSLNNKGQENESTRSRTANITGVGLHIAGGFVRKTYNLIYSELEESDESIKFTETDSPSKSWGMYKTDSGDGSELRFSDELDTDEIAYELETELTLDDYPESLTHEGMTYIRNRFLGYKHNAPSWENDVYVEYVHEDYVDDQP